MEKMSYGEYLKIDELLNLQSPLSRPIEHDEHLFIVIHQSYELWFKQILHEIAFMQTNLKKNNSWLVLKTLERVLVILKVIVAKIDILETMSPIDFKSFRSALKNSSGFQSVQFRKLELILGVHYKSALKNEALTQKDRDDLERFGKQNTIWEDFIHFLQKNYDKTIESPERKDNNGLIFDPNESTQQKIYQIYMKEPALLHLIEHLIDFDEGLQEWRYRHVKMVERTIGDKTGTGGSSGVQYLKSTLHVKVFPDLWAIRNFA